MGRVSFVPRRHSTATRTLFLAGSAGKPDGLAEAVHSGTVIQVLPTAKRKASYGRVSEERYGIAAIKGADTRCRLSLRRIGLPEGGLPIYFIVKNAL